MEAQIKLLSPPDWKILKVIRIDGGRFYPFAGYLAYNRPYANGLINDFVDNSILENIKALFPDSHLTYNERIYTVGLQERILKTVEKSNEKAVQIAFYPDFGEEDLMQFVGKVFNEYTISFSVRTTANDNDDAIRTLRCLAPVKVAHDKIDEIIKTIIPA